MGTSKAAPSPPKSSPKSSPKQKSASSTSPSTSASTHNSTHPSFSLASTPEPSSPSHIASASSPRDPPSRVLGLSPFSFLSDSHHPGKSLNNSSSISPSKDLGYKCPHCGWTGKTQGVLTRHVNVKHK